MQKYKDITGHSGVTDFEIGKDYIKVRFKSREVYNYSHTNPGKKQVETMKELALAGKGLSTFISQFVKDEYESKS